MERRNTSARSWRLTAMLAQMSAIPTVCQQINVHIAHVQALEHRFSLRYLTGDLGHCLAGHGIRQAKGTRL